VKLTEVWPARTLPPWDSRPAVTVRIDPRRILHLKLRTVNLPPVTRSLVGERLTLLT